MTYRTRNIFIAVGLALIAAMLTMFYVANYKRHVRQDEATVPVFLAARDVPAGTAGAELVRKHWIKTDDVTRRTVVAGAIASPDQIDRLVLTQPLYAGEQVTIRRFADVAAQGIRSQLKGTMRAVQIAGDPNQVLAGTLHAGDRVDVVANLDAANAQSAHATRIVLRDLTVLDTAGGAGGGSIASSSGTDSAVLLAVSDTQVQKLYFAYKNADWSLELRPVLDPADSPERVENLQTVLKDGLSQAAISRYVNGGSR
jgi:Flp pilus assembly protein CpaB